MDIRGKSMIELSDMMKPYIADYFNGCRFIDYEHGIFQESYLLEYREIQHLIPVEYQKRFHAGDSFMGSSGCLCFEYVAEPYKRKEYTSMLLATKDQAQALFLYLQIQDNAATTSQDILLVDFIK